jgi:hypothetical protein
MEQKCKLCAVLFKDYEALRVSVSAERYFVEGEVPVVEIKSAKTTLCKSCADKLFAALAGKY